LAGALPAALMLAGGVRVAGGVIGHGLQAGAKSARPTLLAARRPRNGTQASGADPQCGLVCGDGLADEKRKP
jgi:hypothetical protein